MEALVGLVTITYNSADVILPFLQSVFNQTHSNYLLYIIDNNSSDNTLSLIENFSKDSRIKIFANKNNVGVAAGNNQGINAALEDNCTHIHIINNDVEFESQLIEKLLHNLEANKASIITHKMMYASDKSRIWYAGSTFTRWERFMAPHTGQKEIDNGQYDNIKYVDYAPTCSVLLNVKVIHDIGLMDEKYFAYYDDTDFFYRIYKQKRYKILYIPNIDFYHKVGGLTKSKTGTATKFKFGNFHIHLTTRNKVYYLRKQNDVLAYINIIYFFIRLQFRFLFSGKYHHNFATWKLIQKSFVEGFKL
jgi:GT2 family glycosyltransferase